MNALITASGQFGPFTSITQAADRWVCDGIEYQFTVIGEASVGEYVSPAPSEAQTIEPNPTKEELMEQLAALSAQIQALA